MTVVNLPSRVELTSAHTRSNPMVLDTPANAVQAANITIINEGTSTILARQTRYTDWSVVHPRSELQMSIIAGYPCTLELAAAGPLYRYLSLNSPSSNTEIPQPVRLQLNAVEATLYDAAQIISFSADPAAITATESADLQFVFAGGTGSINQSVGAVTSAMDESVTPGSTTTYTLTVDNAHGSVETLAVTVTVVPIPVITSLTADPEIVLTMEESEITAVFTGGTGVLTPGNIPVTSGVPVTVTPALTQEYTLTVSNSIGTGAGVVTDTVTVTIL
jgi:hypothetical protein